MREFDRLLKGLASNVENYAMKFAMQAQCNKQCRHNVSHNYFRLMLSNLYSPLWPHNSTWQTRSRTYRGTVLYRLSMGCHTVSPARVWVRIPGPLTRVFKDITVISCDWYGFSNHRQLDCFSRLFRLILTKASKPFCERNPPVTLIVLSQGPVMKEAFPYHDIMMNLFQASHRAFLEYISDTWRLCEVR